MRRLALALALLACSVSSSACSPAMPSHTVLRVQGNVRDASVTIDDVYVGALAFVAARGVGLPLGRHRITVERAGYFPVDLIVEAKEGEPLKLSIDMTKIPD
jgi:hypothetical protein